MNPRVLFHVQHLLGIGHAKRGAMLARAMAERGLDVTVLSGGEPVALDWGQARIEQLPWVRALDAGFKQLADESGRPPDADFYERRRAQVLAAFARIAPEAVVIEGYPFSRRAFRFELDALLAAATARRPRPAVLCSIRDILVQKADPKRTAEIVARVARDFDAVLVHGDPALTPLALSFTGAAAIAGKLNYTGYVAAPLADDGGKAGAGEVLVSAGGGAVGAALLFAALAARPLTRAADRPWRLIAGPNLPQADFDAVANRAGAGVILERFRADFPSLLRRCHLSVSQAGYNTLLDVMQAGVRAVVVPFAQEGETEQTLRAELLAARGLVHCIAETALDGAAPGAGLAAAIDRALAAPAPEPCGLAMDGARRSATLVAEFAARASRRQ